MAFARFPRAFPSAPVWIVAMMDVVAVAANAKMVRNALTGCVNAFRTVVMQFAEMMGVVVVAGNVRECWNPVWEGNA